MPRCSIFAIFNRNVRKIERRTKLIHLFFMPRCSIFAIFIAKILHLLCLSVPYGIRLYAISKRMMSVTVTRPSPFISTAAASKLSGV